MNVHQKLYVIVIKLKNVIKKENHNYQINKLKNNYLCHLLHK